MTFYYIVFVYLFIICLLSSECKLWEGKDLSYPLLNLQYLKEHLVYR